MQLPPSVQAVFDEGVSSFVDEHCGWNLNIEERISYIEETVGCHVHVIGSNGCGDYIFLKINGETGEPELPLFKFWHEGPEVDQVLDSPAAYFGLEPRGPSGGPVPQYFDGQEVRLGEQVEFKSFFRTKRGIISYITGVSGLNYELETVGIASIEVKQSCGRSYGISATKPGHRLRKSVKIIEKG